MKENIDDLLNPHKPQIPLHRRRRADWRNRAHWRLVNLIELVANELLQRGGRARDTFLQRNDFIVHELEILFFLFLEFARDGLRMKRAVPMNTITC